MARLGSALESRGLWVGEVSITDVGRLRMPGVFGIPQTPRPVARAAIGAGVDGVILRVWVGREGDMPRVPATLRWNEAVELTERLRQIGAVVRK